MPPAFKADHDPWDKNFTVNGKPADPEYGWVMTHPFNMLHNCPVLSVPSGFASTGVPTGIQIVAAPGMMPASSRPRSPMRKHSVAGTRRRASEPQRLYIVERCHASGVPEPPHEAPLRQLRNLDHRRDG
jgi:hypothetical protein